MRLKKTPHRNRIEPNPKSVAASASERMGDDPGVVVSDDSTDVVVVPPLVSTSAGLSTRVVEVFVTVRSPGAPVSSQRAVPNPSIKQHKTRRATVAARRHGFAPSSIAVV